MTAKDLHALPSEGPVPYEGGFTTKDNFGNDAVRHSIAGDEDGVHLHQHIAAGVGGGSSASYSRMSVSEAFEYAGAVERAARAAQKLQRGEAS